MRILTFPEFLENTVSISLANPNPPLKSNFFPEYNLSISSCKFAERACSLRKYECEPGQHESISVCIKEINPQMYEELKANISGDFRTGFI